MLFVLSHYGHARGTPCFSPARPIQLGLPMMSVHLRLPTPQSAPPPNILRPQATRSFLATATMSDRSSPSQDTPSPAPDTGRGGAIRRGPFPMFLMDIAQSDDADRLLRELDMLKDDALEAADTAIQATDPALAALCDALRWTAANGDIQAITAVTGVWTPRGLLLTATVTVAAGPSDTKVIEHVPLSLVQGGPLLEYVSKDPEALTAALVTRWSPSHAPISASRLRSQVFKGLYTAREQPPPVDTAGPPDIQSQKVSHKIHKPISQFLAPHLRPSWDRLRTREVVAAFWALPNDVHAVLQAAHIPTADLVPLKFGLLAWASSVCLTGQYTPAPVPTPPALANKGMWTPEQLRPLLECSVLPIRSVELLHQIEQAGEHSWATAPTFALLQAGIADTANPPPLTPPSHAPYLTRGQAAPSPAATLFATAAFTPASALYKAQGKPTPSGSEQSPSSLLPEQTRLSFNLPEPASQVPPAAADPTPPESPAPAVGSAPPSPSQVGEPFVPDLDVTAYSTDYAQLHDEYEAQRRVLAVARGDLESLTRDLDTMRTERDNAQQQAQRCAAAQRQTEAVRLNNFIRSVPPLLSIATRLHGLQSTPPAFANAVRSTVPASFELPPPGSQQFLVLVPVILAAAVLTSPQAPNLEELADVLRRAMAAPGAVPVPETPARAPELSFAVPDPIPKPRAVSAFRAPGATAQPPPSLPSPDDAALTDLLEWIPEIPKGCEDEVAHALHLQLFRQYGAKVNTLPQSPIREQWAWVHSHAPSLPGIAEVLRSFLSNPPAVQRVSASPATSPSEAAAANQAQGAAKKKGYTPQKIDPQVFSKALWVGWQEVDDPPSGEVDAGLLGGILRDKFGAGLSSITEEQLNHTSKFTIVGIRPAEYERGMRLTRQHTARGWRVTWAESKKQPFTPWVPDPDRDHPPRKTHRGSRGKQRRPRDPDDRVDLTATSGSDGEPDSKYQRRYSPRRSDRSPSRRRSPGHRRDSPPPRRRSAYRDEPQALSSRHDHHAAAPLLPYPYSGDPHDPRVAMAHNPYAPPPWSPPADPHRYQPYFGRHPRDR